MQQALAIAILGIGGIFVLLTLLIVANKAWREARERRARRRRVVLEPLVLGYAHGDGENFSAALGDEARDSDRDVLEQILLDHVQRVRGIEHGRLTAALEQLGFVERHLEGLGSRRWWRRAESAERLGLAGANRAVEPLSAALEDDVPEVRMRAAKALGLLGGSTSVRVLVRALNEPNRWSTIRIADILTDLGRKMLDDLIAAFPELNRTGKLAALDVLGRVRSLQTAPWLIERLSDDQADVRARACHALGSIADPNLTSELVGALEDKAWPVRAMSAKALGRIRNAETIPALCGALRDRQWWVRSNAAHALREMEERGVEALEWMLLDEDRYARHQAVLMLTQAGVVDARAQALASADVSERSSAADFVRKLVAAGQTERLAALSGNHPDAAVRHALAEILPPPEDSQEAVS